MAATAATAKQLQQLDDYLETMRLLTVSSVRFFATYLKANTLTVRKMKILPISLTESHSVASSVLIVYDYFLTLGMEIDRI
jgi:hypothetical protein